MTLKEANMQLEKLENDYEYYLNEKEKLLTTVLPKATDIRGERVDGGKRTDRLLEYMEQIDTKQIDATIDYIHNRKQNLINKHQQALNDWLNIMAQKDNVSIVAVETQRRKAQRKINNENIEVVLFHDYNRVTLSMLPEAIEYLQSKGYVILPLFYESVKINK